jgi:hypothetical protein
MLKIKKKLNSQILIIDKLDKILKFKRIFFLSTNKKTVRGRHAHKKCTQVFFCLKGSYRLNLIKNNGMKKDIIMNTKKKIQLIKPFTWVTIYLNKNSICGVLCDRYYDEKDYIRNFKEFKNTK